MKIKFLILGALLAGLALVPTTASGLGSDPTAKAFFHGKIEPLGKGATRGASARLTVHYRCTKGDHLWVSVKQAASRKKDPALTQEGSSAYAETWLQSHRNRFTCNGKPRTERFYVDKLEPGAGKGALKRGWAWVQFCVTTGEELTLYSVGWMASYR